jgi:hypothetical protein
MHARVGKSEHFDKKENGSNSWYSHPDEFFFSLRVMAVTRGASADKLCCLLEEDNFVGYELRYFHARCGRACL